MRTTSNGAIVGETSKSSRFGQLLFTAMALVILGALGAFGASFYFIHVTARSEEATLAQNAELEVDELRLTSGVDRMSASVRGYFLSGDARSLTRFRQAQAKLQASMARIDDDLAGSSGAELDDDLRSTEAAYREALDGAIGMVGTPPNPERVRATLEEIRPIRAELDASLHALRTYVERRQQGAERTSRVASNRATMVLAGMVAAVVILSIVLSLLLIRNHRQLIAKEEETRVHVARIEAANRDLDAFAGRIAHDLRNAVAPQLFLASQLKRSQHRPEVVVDLAGRLARSTKKCMAILENLLAFSRGFASSSDQPACRIRPVVDDVLQEVHALSTSVAAEIVPEVDDLAIACAPGLLHSVIANLVNNALKFLVGRPVRRVMVSVKAVDGAANVVVEDTGPGIPPEALDRVFEPFYRVPGSAAPGTGIGLATVHRIVTAHGGRVAVRSSVGEGTTFTIVLPLALSGSKEERPSRLQPVGRS